MMLTVNQHARQRSFMKLSLVPLCRVLQGHLCREPIDVEIRVSSDRLAHQHWRLGVHRFGEVDIISAAD